MPDDRPLDSPAVGNVGDAIRDGRLRFDDDHGPEGKRRIIPRDLAEKIETIDAGERWIENENAEVPGADLRDRTFETRGGLHFEKDALERPLNERPRRRFSRDDQHSISSFSLSVHGRGSLPRDAMVASARQPLVIGPLEARQKSPAARSQTVGRSPRQSL